MIKLDEIYAWRALPVPLMAHDDPKRSWLIYARIVRGDVIRWSAELEPWATHWVLLPVEA